jgi:hypothetical protein
MWRLLPGLSVSLGGSMFSFVPAGSGWTLLHNSRQRIGSRCGGLGGVAQGGQGVEGEGRECMRGWVGGLEVVPTGSGWIRRRCSRPRTGSW